MDPATGQPVKIVVKNTPTVKDGSSVTLTPGTTTKKKDDKAEDAKPAEEKKDDKAADAKPAEEKKDDAAPPADAPKEEAKE